MSKQMKRWAKFVGLSMTIAAMALFASACGSDSDESDTGASGGSCELSVFSWWTGGGEAAGLDKLIKIWNEDNSDCQFKNEAVAGGAGTNAKAVLAQRLAANKPPDSFQGHAGKELLDYILADQIEPIDDIYDEAGLRDKMPSTLIDQITYEGHIYSVPVNIHRANILWFNPKVLDQAGIAAAPATWDEFIAALDKAKAADVIPLALGEQWTQKHLLETVMIGRLGTDGWAALWEAGGDWSSADVTDALDRFKTLLTYTNSDAASLTWQDAGKLVIDGKAAFNVMGDWQDGYFSGSLEGDNLAKTPKVDYDWVAVPETEGVFDWLSDSFTLPKGAPHRDAAVDWLTFLGTQEAQDAFNPVKGSIPALTETDASLYGEYLQWNLDEWKNDDLACSLAHGCAASNAWNADIDTALGLFLQNKDVAKFQSALVKAAQKNA